MRRVKRILIGVCLLVVLLTVAVVLLVGPWPLYSDARYKDARYYRDAIAAIDSVPIAGSAPWPLRAGWATREVTPPVGHPMAGYSGRANDKRASGIHDSILIKALALNDGSDTVVVVGTDLLQTLPNMLELIERKSGFPNAQVLYTSSHTHGGPGGFAPGRVAEEAFGHYTPEYLEALTDGMAAAIREAVDTLAPARLAHAAVDAPEYIRNRCRPDAPVDATLHVAAVENSAGQRLYIARYSAHGTVFGEEMMEVNGDFASAFQRAAEARLGAPLLYMGGAVGSMKPNPPGPPLPAPRTPEEALGFENDIEAALVREGKKTLEALVADQTARAEAMGAALTEKLATAAAGFVYEDRVDIAAIVVPYQPTPAQVRLFSPKWRLSPFAFRLLGVPTEGRLQAARVGSMLLVGLPYDVCGELSQAWQAEMAPSGRALWVTSFSGAYLGYLSPDAYYEQIGEAYGYNQNYEIGEMGWFGPNQGAYVGELVYHALARLAPRK